MGEIEQVHEDWKKGAYELALTRKSIRCNEACNEAKRYPDKINISHAAAEVSSFLDFLICGKYKKNVDALQLLKGKVEKIYLLLSSGISGLKLKFENVEYMISWTESDHITKTRNLKNIQILPLILSDVFSEGMNLAQTLGFFLQKPSEKRYGITAYMEASGVDTNMDDLGEEFDSEIENDL